jgi:hypothetical protein
MVPGTPFSEKVVIALNVEAALTPLPTTPPPPQPESASTKAATDKNIRNAILFNIGVSVFNSASPYFAISNECATQTLCLWFIARISVHFFAANRRTKKHFYLKVFRPRSWHRYFGILTVFQLDALDRFA